MEWKTLNRVLQPDDAHGSLPRCHEGPRGCLPRATDCMSVLVVHPGLQHAHQLAWALHEVNLLQGFWSGVPIQATGSSIGRWLPAYLARKLKEVDVPAQMCRHPVWFPVLSRSTRWLPRAMHPGDVACRIDHWFDAWAAPRVVQARPRAVVAYENAARDTFRAAKAAGVRCILDAASIHHEMGARLNPVAPTPYLRQVNQRKAEEIELADLILTCSPLAAESYRAAGVPDSKLQPISLGANLPTVDFEWKKHSKPLHFVFAGALSRRKAIDLILEAFSALYALGMPYRLSFVGGEAEPGWVEKIQNLPEATYFPSMAQRDLFAFIEDADCLLLPSRYDAFGMVVAEAMAVGTPAIVSTNTGAKLMIDAVPGAGWVVDCNADSLFDCVHARLSDRTSLFDARAHAREAARQFTWSAYRHRAGSAIAHWLS